MRLYPRLGYLLGLLPREKSFLLSTLIFLPSLGNEFDCVTVACHCHTRQQLSRVFGGEAWLLLDVEFTRPIVFVKIPRA